MTSLSPDGRSPATLDLAMVARELRAARDEPPSSSRNFPKEWYGIFARKNGFTKPLSKLQLLSWITFTVDVVLGAIIAVPILLSESRWFGWLISTLWLISTIFLIGSTYTATHCDPGRKSRPLESTRFCLFCKRNVSADAKHCRQCNKCIDDFDHHCEWLNNCVGRENYTAFIFAATSAFVFTTLLVAFSGLEISRYIGDGSEATVYRWKRVYNRADDETLVGLSLTLLLVNLPLTLCTLQLLAFHAFLAYKGLTTYEYIVYKLNGEEAERSRPPQGRRVWNRFKSLPTIMDWFVFIGRSKRSSGEARDGSPPLQVDIESRCNSSSSSRRVEPTEVIIESPKKTVG